ncbi:hypothetical protein, partial [Priestia megaterium]|uniref:hypothetical protein n=2 Tax=Bacillati TaxID=1783272 RepID=UPI00366DA4E8
SHSIVCRKHEALAVDTRTVMRRTTTGPFMAVLAISPQAQQGTLICGYISVFLQWTEQLLTSVYFTPLNGSWVTKEKRATVPD